jgi:hypothetical protein
VTEGMSQTPERRSGAERPLILKSGVVVMRLIMINGRGRWAIRDRVMKVCFHFCAGQRPSPGSTDVDVGHHEVDGPVHVTPVSATRLFPLREPIKQVWSEIGLTYSPGDASGKSAGTCEFLEKRYEGKRQASYQTYSLAGIKVLTEATAHRVEFEDNDQPEGISKASMVLFCRWTTH